MFLGALEVIQTEPQEYQKHIFTVLSSTMAAEIELVNMMGYDSD